MAPHSSSLAWKIPWTEEPGGAEVHGVTKSRTRLSDFTFTFHFHALEKEMATYASVLAWRIPGIGEPGGLPSMGSHSQTLKQRSSSSSSLYIWVTQLISVGKLTGKFKFKTWDMRNRYTCKAPPSVPLRPSALIITRIKGDWYRWSYNCEWSFIICKWVHRNY